MRSGASRKNVGILITKILIWKLCETLLGEYFQVLKILEQKFVHYALLSITPLQVANRVL
ncbi:hypothetical protein HMPREF2611_20700 [Pseudomonas aeruginosa]|nr:hypothetical protein HMPREF2789_20950 [Pseudomonas aeruginosa]OHQ64334.1 hypothetical protein HMPREF2611_20700 [Pseudomonas aeruginosa]